MDAFFNSVSKFATLNEDSVQAFASVMKRHELPKGRTLVQAHTICDQLYFIETGLSRTYYIKDGKYVTDWISAEGEFAVSIISFTTQQPDRRAVELLESSVLWSISYQALENLYQAHHEIEHLGRLLLTYGCISLQQRFDDLHFATAAERYQTLLATRPTLLQRVPLGIIASYLGMSQETLSRMRAQH